MLSLIGLGAGGHSKVMLDVIRTAGMYECIGLLDANPSLIGSEVLGVPVLGGDDLLPDVHEKGVNHLFIGVGMVGNARPRKHLYELALKSGFTVISVIHRQSIISSVAKYGNGLTVLAGAIINAEALIGNNVLINTGAIVEHDCTIGDHSHIATGARLAGGVHVEAEAHIGIGASIREGIHVGRKSLVGAGAAVINDVEAGTVVAGVPARVVRRVEV